MPVDHDSCPIISLTKFSTAEFIMLVAFILVLSFFFKNSLLSENIHCLIFKVNSRGTKESEVRKNKC